MLSLELLVKNGVQFGHQSWRVCPKMKPYIWGEKNGVHLIDVSKTAQSIERASQFLEEVAARGEPILWVGTKQAAQPVIEQAAQRINAPYVSNRWIGGTLTNFSEVKKAIAKLKHYEELLEHSEKMYTKKEYGQFRKVVARIEENVGGIRNITWPIGALVVVDAKKEHVAVKEAIKAGIPVVALTDTNTDPTGIDHVIPGNDDISRSVRVVLDPLVEAVQRGTQKAEQEVERQQQERQKQEQRETADQEQASHMSQDSQDQAEQTDQSAKTQQEAASSQQQAQKKATTRQSGGEKQASTAKGSTQKSSGEKKSTQSRQTKSSTSTTKSSAQKSGTSRAASSSTSSSKKSTATSKKSSTTQAASSAEKKQSDATGDDEPVTTSSDEE